MSNINARLEAITDENAKLDELYPAGFLFTTSIDNATKGSTAGTVSELSTRNAAQQIVDGLARPSTPEEIAALHQ